MLWEASDPDREVTARFGFRDGAAAAEWVAAALDRHWDLAVARCDRIVISGGNAMAWVEAGGRSLIAKWSSHPGRFGHLQDVARVVAWIDGAGVPVAAPVATRDGRLLVELADEARGRRAARRPRPGSRVLLGVLPVVDGDLLAVDDPAQVAEAGRMLATLHGRLAACPEPVGGRRRSGEQLVHNDFRSANVLHDGTRITAVLDFEELTRATRAVDLAKASVLLATRYHDWGPTSAEVRAAFVAAYGDAADVVLTPTERREVDRHATAVLRSFGWT